MTSMWMSEAPVVGKQGCLSEGNVRDSVYGEKDVRPKTSDENAVFPRFRLASSPLDMTCCAVAMISGCAQNGGSSCTVLMHE